MIKFLNRKLIAKLQFVTLFCVLFPVSQIMFNDDPPVTQISFNDDPPVTQISFNDDPPVTQILS